MAHVSFATPVGAMTVFAHEDALVALEWGSTAATEVTPFLERVRDGLLRYFDGEPLPLDWLLAPAGTAFQQRVWNRLRAIPFGTTVSYGTLAHDVDSAPRAVASACARNPLPIVIPCHRVIAADGSLGGYSGGEGLPTKAALLSLEGITLPPAKCPALV